MNPIPYEEAVRGAARRPARSYPSHEDSRCRDGALFAAFAPRFPLRMEPGSKVFTMGSCFARNIEKALEERGVRVPTRKFKAPAEEREGRSNGLLNEFNPGTMAQRILSALSGTLPSEATLVDGADGVHDLLLPTVIGVPADRARERRQRIAQIYRALPKCEAIIMTLGFVECWYDTLAGQYLNRMPPRAVALAAPARFEFRRLDADEVVALLAPAFAGLQERDTRTILTVSPVPLQSTFVAEDCVLANEYSKSVLRVAAETLRRRFDLVDYFPSYEIVRSGGLSSYKPDHVHVRDELIRAVTAYMVERYATSDSV